MNVGPDAWRLRDRPLPATAVVGIGPVAVALAERALAREDLAGWRGAAGDGLILLEAPPDALPWADGATFLGRDPDAPAMLLPTAWRPPVHAGLLQRRLGAVALILEPPRSLPLSRLGPLDRDALRRWLESP